MARVGGLEIIGGFQELRNVDESGRRTEDRFVRSTRAYAHRKLDEEVPMCELWQELQS